MAQSFLDMLRGRVPDAVKAAPAEPLQKVGTQGPAPRRGADVAELLRTYSTSELAYACIQIKRKAMQDPRLIVEERTRDGDWAPSPNHPLQRLLMRPLAPSRGSPGMDGATFMGLYVASMDIAGIFYAEKVRSKGGAVVGLNALNPSYMTPWLDTNREQIGYTWKKGRERVDFPFEDLLIRQNPDWTDASPLSVALGAIDTDTAQLGFARAFYNSGGQPSGIIKKKGIVNQEKADEIAARWVAKYGRRGDGWSRPAVLDDNTEYQQVGAKLNELASQTLVGIFESRICMAFGIPPLIVYAYVGLLRATYSNLKEAWSNFWDAELSPMLKAYREFLTWNLLTEFASEELIYGDRIRLRWDLSQVAALQDDVDALTNRVRGNYLAGLIDFNEARSGVGYAPIAGRDNEFVGSSTAPVAVGAPSQTDVVSGGKSRKARKARDADIETIQAKMEKAVRAYLVGEYRAAAAAARAG